MRAADIPKLQKKAQIVVVWKRQLRTRVGTPAAETGLRQEMQMNELLIASAYFSHDPCVFPANSYNNDNKASLQSIEKRASGECRDAGEAPRLL